MNFQKLKYFIEAAECGSFSVAARNLYTTQPNISKQIKVMEDELGYKLFIRSERSISLTPAGKHIYMELKYIPAVIDGVFAQAREISSCSHRPFIIGSLMFPAITAALGNAAMALNGVASTISYEVEVGSFSQLRAKLVSGHFDMVILYTFDIPGIECETEYMVLSKQKAAIVVNTEHPLAGTAGLSLADFKDYSFVATSPNESLTNYNGFIEMCAQRGFVPNISRTAKTLESLLLCVELGLGACLVDDNLPLTDYQNLVSIPLNDNIYSEIAVVWRRNNPDPMIRQFAQTLSDLLKRPSYGTIS